MQQRALITGNSSGLGRSLSQVLLERGWRVYGCSRRGCDLSGEIRDAVCDLTELDAVPRVLDALLSDVRVLDLVVLNAGILGAIKGNCPRRSAKTALWCCTRVGASGKFPTTAARPAFGERVAGFLVRLK